MQLLKDPKRILLPLMAAAVLSEGYGYSERKSSHVPKTQYKRKVWLKRKKRLAMQKQSRKINRK